MLLTLTFCTGVADLDLGAGVADLDLCAGVADLDLCAGVADLDLRVAASVPSVPRNARRELHSSNQVRGLPMLDLSTSVKFVSFRIPILNRSSL